MHVQNLEVVDPNVMNEPRCVVVVCVAGNFACFAVVILSGFEAILHNTGSGLRWRDPRYVDSLSDVIPLCDMNLKPKTFP